MDGKIELEIVTPERLVLSESVDDVQLPGSEGYLGVLPGHAPLLTALGVGEVAFRKEGKPELVAVAGGFAEVLRDRVTILAETAERAQEIDPERARRAGERAQAAMLRDPSDAESREAQISFRKALVRLQVHERGS